MMNVNENGSQAWDSRYDYEYREFKTKLDRLVIDSLIGIKRVGTL